MTLIHRSEAEALAAGQHGNPFSVLGLHGEGSSRRIVALVPDAERLWAVGARGKKVELQPVCHGVFEGKWTSSIV